MSSCSICQEEFGPTSSSEKEDCSNHIPIVGKCGHSVCEPCLVSPEVTRNRLNCPMLECPLCRKKFAFENMARNFQMIGQLELQMTDSLRPAYEAMESHIREVAELRFQLEQEYTTDNTGEYLSESDVSETSEADDNYSRQTDGSESEILQAVVYGVESMQWGEIKRPVILQNTSTFEYVHYDVIVPSRVDLSDAHSRSTIGPGDEKLIYITHHPHANNCSIVVDYWVDGKRKRRKNPDYDHVLVIEFPWV